MSTPAILFSIYLLVGLILMIFAVATPGKEKRAKGFASLGAGDGFDAGLMIFVALLWPVWLLAMLGKKAPIQPPQHNAGSRPLSDDSSASRTSSSLGPRG